MIEICIVFGMNVYGCAVIGGLCAVIGGSIGGVVGVRSLYEIVFSEIGPDAGVIGAINLAMDYMFSLPAMSADPSKG